MEKISIKPMGEFMISYYKIPFMFSDNYAAQWMANLKDKFHVKFYSLTNLASYQVENMSIQLPETSTKDDIYGIMKSDHIDVISATGMYKDVMVDVGIDMKSKNIFITVNKNRVPMGDELASKIFGC